MHILRHDVQNISLEVHSQKFSQVLSYNIMELVSAILHEYLINLGSCYILRYDSNRGFIQFFFFNLDTCRPNIFWCPSGKQLLD